MFFAKSDGNELTTQNISDFAFLSVLEYFLEKNHLDNSGKVWLIRTRSFLWRNLKTFETLFHLFLCVSLILHFRAYWSSVFCVFGHMCIAFATWETVRTRFALPFGRHSWADLRGIILASRSYKHLQHQVTGSASVFLNLQSSYAYGRVVSDPIEGAPYDERPLLVLRNAAGA